MSDRSKFIRFRPILLDAGLEPRTLMTARLRARVPAETAEISIARRSPVAPPPVHAGQARPMVHAAGHPGAVVTAAARPVRKVRRPIVPSGTVSNSLFAESNQPATFEVTGPDSIRVKTSDGRTERTADLWIPPLERVPVDEKLDSLPIFDSTQFGWLQGTRLAGVSAQEGVISGILVPDSFVVRREGDAEPLVRDVDYVVDTYWGTIGRTESGRLGENEAVYVSYETVPPRIDMVVLKADGSIVLRSGQPSMQISSWPIAESGEKVLGRIYRKGPDSQLAAKDLYPVQAVDSGKTGSSARKDRKNDQLKDIMRKLRSGQELRILAWGDSVTDGRYLSSPSTMRWQDQFVAQLRAAFPRARITLMTEAWPGHGMADYLATGRDSHKSFDTSVLGLRPDLVISEFVNDAYLSESETVDQYSRISEQFRDAGIGWIVMTPHFTSPDFMGAGPDFNGGYDPRPYVAGLRSFSAATGDILADNSALWSKLKAQGIPYVGLLSNGINHPTSTGLKLYADALKGIFATR